MAGVNDRFLGTAKGTNVEKDVVKDAVKAANFSKLSGM